MADPRPAGVLPGWVAWLVYVDDFVAFQRGDLPVIVPVPGGRVPPGQHRPGIDDRGVGVKRFAGAGHPLGPGQCVHRLQQRLAGHARSRAGPAAQILFDDHRGQAALDRPVRDVFPVDPAPITITSYSRQSAMPASRPCTVKSYQPWFPRFTFYLGACT